MSIALDCGTSRFRSVRPSGAGLAGRSVPALFALLADTPATRDLLTRAAVPFAHGEGELVLVGEAARTHAASFQVPLLRLLPDGVLPTDDPPARQVLGVLVEAILPAARPRASHGPCCVILPVAAREDVRTREFLLRLIRLRGHDPILLSDAHALALATLSQEGFSGLAVSLGAGGCVMSLVHRGRELAVASEARGGDWIDAQLATTDRLYAHDIAGDRYLDLETASHRRETLTAPLTQGDDDGAEQVAGHVRQILGVVAERLTREITFQRLGRFSTALPVICGGGVLRAAGSTALVRTALSAADIPLPLGDFRHAPADPYLSARGALISAELETIPQPLAA